jgi:hypothetical protein
LLIDLKGKKYFYKKIHIHDIEFAEIQVKTDSLLRIKFNELKLYPHVAPLPLPPVDAGYISFRYNTSA